ncbi:hypothetical protein AAC387_Pa01g1392 [Persea americana]
MTAIFHDLMGDIVEDYVDDDLVESSTASLHIQHLEKIVEQLLQYQLRCTRTPGCPSLKLSLSKSKLVVELGLLKNSPKKRSKRGRRRRSPCQNVHWCYDSSSTKMGLQPAAEKATSQQENHQKKGRRYHQRRRWQHLSQHLG